MAAMTIRKVSPLKPLKVCVIQAITDCSTPHSSASNALQIGMVEDTRMISSQFTPLAMRWVRLMYGSPFSFFTSASATMQSAPTPRILISSSTAMPGMVSGRILGRASARIKTASTSAPTFWSLFIF